MYVPFTHTYNCRDKQVSGLGRNEYGGRNTWSGFSVFESDFVVNVIRIKCDSHCTIIMTAQILYYFMSKSAKFP
jgi:hypothetical protein